MDRGFKNDTDNISLVSKGDRTGHKGQHFSK